MALKVKPLSDRVVVEPAPAEDVSSGGIILPDTAQEKPQQGTMLLLAQEKYQILEKLWQWKLKKEIGYFMENIVVPNSHLKVLII